MNEQGRKLEIIRTWMTSRNLGALYLQSAGSFAWATCGASSFINIASTNGLASLLITQEHQYLITTNIEAPRLEVEQQLVASGWDFQINPWYEAPATIARLSHGSMLASDGAFPGAQDLSADLARLRANLTPEEGQRFISLGKACAQAMQAACHTVRPGQTEYQIAANLAAQAESRGTQAIVNLIATDERIFAYRHPLPTGKKLEKYAMLILCGRQHGLVCSLTRLVHFGALPDELTRKMEATARVDAEFICSTRPGQTLGNIFDKAIRMYTESGYPDEWKKHHQGGTSGYEPREYLALPGSTDRVAAGQVYAWNPSITGYKSEDTVLVGETKNEVLTEISGWPLLTTDGFARPAILVV